MSEEHTLKANGLSAQGSLINRRVRSDKQGTGPASKFTHAGIDRHEHQ